MPDGILRRGYEALGRGDAGPLLALLPDAFEWVEPDLPGYAAGGVHNGAEGFATGVLAPLAEALEGLTFEFEDVIEAGPREVATGVMRGRPAGSGGEEWVLPFAHVWELEDGLFVRGRGYFDRSRMTLAAGRRQLADVADELLDQAAEIRQQWSRLGDALRAAGVEATSVPDGDTADAGELAGAQGGAASARLVAVDMAQEGTTRADVDAYLRDELGIDDTGAILDEAFGGDPADPPPDGPGAIDPSRLTRLFARNRG